jgi:TrmH family RNA methyltransferase
MSVTTAAFDDAKPERVSSADNATVKHFAKLVKSRSYREECGSIVVAGAGLLQEIYGSGGGGAVARATIGDAKAVFLADEYDGGGLPIGVRARRTIRAPENVMKKAAGLLSVDALDAVVGTRYITRTRRGPPDSLAVIRGVLRPLS